MVTCPHEDCKRLTDYPIWRRIKEHGRARLGASAKTKGICMEIRALRMSNRLAASKFAAFCMGDQSGV